MKKGRKSVLDFCWQLVLATTVLALATGCLFFPTPGLSSADSRTNVGKQTPPQFEPGKTTRAEVILTLGEPDAVSPDERKVAYRSERIVGLWALFSYAGPPMGGNFTKDRYLVTEFDPSGTLVRVENTSTWVGSKHASLLLGYANRGAEPGGASGGTGTSTPGGLMLRCSWFAGVDGFKGRAADSLGQMGRLWLGDTRLEFYSDAQFANAEPVLILAYDSLTEVRIAKYLLGRRLVIRSRAGAPHSFQFYGATGNDPGNAALQAALTFLQARVKP